MSEEKKKRKYKAKPVGWSKQKSPPREGNNSATQSEDISKKDELDILKQDGGDEMPDIDYDKIASMQRGIMREVIQEMQQPQREAEQIEEAVKKEVPKVVKSEVEERIESLKSSLKDEIKGLSKDEATQLVEGQFQELIKKECEDPNSLSCQMAKNTASAVVDEVLKKRSKEKKSFEIPKITDEFEEKWKKLSPEERKTLDLIPAKAHKTMLEILLESPESSEGLNKQVLSRLSEQKLIEIINDKPELAVTIGKAMCGANEACKTNWNKAIEESSEIKEEEKKNWLLK